MKKTKVIDGKPIVNNDLYALPERLDDKIRKIPYSHAPHSIGIAYVKGSFHVYETNERGVVFSDYICSNYGEACKEAAEYYSALLEYANKYRNEDTAPLSKDKGNEQTIELAGIEMVSYRKNRHGVGILPETLIPGERVGRGHVRYSVESLRSKGPAGLRLRRTLSSKRLKRIGRVKRKSMD